MKRKNLSDHVRLADAIHKNLFNITNYRYSDHHLEFYKVSDILGSLFPPVGVELPKNPGKTQQLIIKAMDLLVERGILLRPDPMAFKWKYRYYVKPPKYDYKPDLPKVNRCPRCDFVVKGETRRHKRASLPHTLEECQLNKTQGILDA